MANVEQGVGRWNILSNQQRDELRLREHQYRGLDKDYNELPIFVL
jgi:hypothetical protein